MEKLRNKRTGFMGMMDYVGGLLDNAVDYAGDSSARAYDAAVNYVAPPQQLAQPPELPQAPPPVYEPTMMDRVAAGKGKRLYDRQYMQMKKDGLME